MRGACGKFTLPFWPTSGLVTQTPQWQESNRALARLLAIHHRTLVNAIAVAVEIRRAIDQLTPWMTALSNRTCRFCPEPCCIGNTVWIDFRDLLFLHLLEESIPSSQATSDPDDACPFLSHRGCRLPLRIRPWMCIQYICPTQRAILKRTGRPKAAALFGKIRWIGRKRILMETEVVRRIKRKNRTSPSSSLASSG